MVCQNPLLVFFLPLKLFLHNGLFYWFFLIHQLVSVSMCKGLIFGLSLFSMCTHFLGDLTQNRYLKYNLCADDLKIYIYSLYVCITPLNSRLVYPSVYSTSTTDVSNKTWSKLIYWFVFLSQQMTTLFFQSRRSHPLILTFFHAYHQHIQNPTNFSLSPPVTF